MKHARAVCKMQCQQNSDPYIGQISDYQLGWWLNQSNDVKNKKVVHRK